MKHIMNVVALLSVAGAAYGQIRTQHLGGSDTVAFLTRDIIRHLSLGSGNDPLLIPCPDTDALCYDGGGSYLGYLDCGDARYSGQGMSPVSRPVYSGDQDNAHNQHLEFVVPQ